MEVLVFVSVKKKNLTLINSYLDSKANNLSKSLNLQDGI